METNSLQSLWSNWYFHDALMVVLLVFMGWVGYRLSQRVYWRNAFREVFERRSVRVCFASCASTRLLR